jgi:hypothetical protein
LLCAPVIAGPYDVDMSRLIARILLAISIWPLAALVYLMTFVVVVEGMRGSSYGDRESRGFGIAGCATWMFVGGYWILLWRKSIVWTAGRRGLTFGAIFGSMVAAGLIGGLMGGIIGAEFGWFIGSVTAPVLWLVATVLIWRESAGERAARLANGGRDAIVCPTCGYNLTGLREARCPECGTQFTVDQLLAAQPARAGADLEG